MEGTVSSSRAAGVVDISADTAPPLPANCNGLALPGEPAPEACVYGYVYLDGVPVSGANVTLRSDTGSLSVNTMPGSASNNPYYSAALSESPLQAETGSIISANTLYNSRANRTSFEVVSGSQQVDLWLSSACGPTNVGGIISSDTTWTRACGPYVVTANLLVQNGFKLTIEAGVTVLVQADKALQVDGFLDAQGQANAMITFTSAELNPAAGDWGYLLLVDGVEHTPLDQLVYALIEYGGGVSVSDNGALRINNAWPILQHLTVRHNASDGVHFYGDATGAINHSHTYDNTGYGIYAYSNTLSANNDMLYVHHNGSGGLYIKGVGVYWLYDSTISDNNGTGVYVFGASAPHIDFIAERILVQRNRTNTFDGAGISIYGYGHTSTAVSNSLILENDAYGSSRSGGGISCSVDCELSHNIIYRNHAASYGGGIYLQAGASTYSYKIHHNIIVANRSDRAGGGIYHGSYTNASTSISNNTILGNQSADDGAGLHVLSTIPVLGNTILINTSTDATGGGVYVKKNPVLNANNLYGNAPFDLSNGNAQGTSNVNAEQNFWGTADPALIPALIWDWMDASALGLVDFEPFATAHNLDAPISPPKGLTASALGTSITLSWSANPEADLAGYKIYYDDDEPGFPYNGNGANEGSSPITIAAATSFTLTGLPPGSYYLTVTAFDNHADGVRDQTDGNESWFAPDQVATVEGPPSADFSASPTSGPAPLQVNFTNLSSGNYTTCAWNFGDGGNSSQCSNPSHTYTAAGVYKVSLMVSGLGGSDTEVKNNYITAYAPATADFSGSPTSGVAPLTVNFTNLSSGVYTTCAWNFGDGGTSNQCNNPSHVYQAAGSYQVSLTISGAGGTDTRIRPGYITAGDVLLADFYATLIRGTAPLSVTFFNLSTGSFTTCAWNFGDGGTSSQCNNPSHVYQNEGTYTVSLTVSGDGGTDSRSRSRFITVVAAGNAWHSGGPYGGYVNTLATANINPDVIYAGTDSGVYKSTNGGVQWAKTGHLDIKVYSLVVSPGNINIIYSGTTDGIYKSTDGGETWLPKGMVKKAVESLAIDPRNPSTLFAGTAGGIYKSVNSGDAWVRKYAHVELEAVHSLVVDSDDSLYVYAATSPSGLWSYDDGLFKSTDGGETWSPRHVASDDWNDEDVYALAMTPAAAPVRALYAFSLSGEDDVYKSVDRGESWVPCDLPGEWWTEMAPVALTVDPSNPNRVYLGLGEYSGQVYLSTDAGDTWQLKVNGLPEGSPASFLVDPRNGYALIALQNGGVHRSTDTAEHWSYSSAGMSNTDIVGLAIHPTSSATGFASIRGRGHPLAKTVDQGFSWINLDGIPSGYIAEIPVEPGAIAYDPQSPLTVYTGEGWEYVEDLYLYKSMDGGNNWQSLKFMDGDLSYWEEHGVADIWVHPNNSNILLVAVEGWGGANSAGGVYRSYNGGYSWTRPFTFWSTTIAANPANPNIVYVGTRQCGYVYRSNSAGSSWTNISPTMPPGECWVWSVSDLEVDENGHVYAATSTGLMKWDGLGWTQLTGFPGLATALAFDRTTTPQTLYIGTTYMGIYASQDYGGTWQAFNHGLGNLSIRRLYLASNPTRLLYAGTASAGVWVRDLSEPVGYKLYLPLLNK